jgi:hypothetical protein
MVQIVNTGMPSQSPARVTRKLVQQSKMPPEKTDDIDSNRTRTKPTYGDALEITSISLA